MTSTTRLHRIVVALLTCVVLASLAAAAHAQEVGPQGSEGRSCAWSDQGLPDGGVIIYRTRDERGTYTCTDGEVCWSWKPTGAGSKWHYRCWYSPGQELITTARPTTHKTVTTATAHL